MDPITLFAVGSAISSGSQALAANAQGNQEASNMEAEARLSDTQALQRDTQLRDELDRFISTQRAARAANGLSSSSPNALMLFNEANNVSAKERTTQTANDRQRAANLRAGAAGARRGARMSLITGFARAITPLAELKM